jgi:tetrahydromethanopterin S-methyltransferase subunit G
MAKKKIRLEDLAGMIAKGFNENTQQHWQIFNRLDRIDMKLEGVVYRREFDELKRRVDELENLLAIPKKT